LYTGSVLQDAGMTAVLGMSVVFLALFLLSAYMHYFKILIARIERKKTALDGPVSDQPLKPLNQSPAPVTARDETVHDEGSRLAAAVAVGLYLRGVRAAPTDAVAAAIATALTLHERSIPPARETLFGPASSWRLAGRLEAMASRSRSRERPSVR
jgi:Na+-transporting methylmalonyl-CoA/oxaloacetate decarboxylase gamma subunit